MLTSLAVAVACSLGAAALPVGAAAAAQAAPTAAVDPAAVTAFPSAGPALRTNLDALGVPRRGLPTAAGHAAAVSAASGTSAPQLAGPGQPAEAPAVVPPRRGSVVPVLDRHAPVGRTPAALGSRAPPAR